MRFAALFLALAAAACIACAAEQSTLGIFISTHFEPDSPAQASPLFADGNFYLVTSGGKEIYVVNASSGASISSLPVLADILEQDGRNRDGYEAKIASAASFSGKVEDAKGKDEGKCLQYIGDDGDPGCTDRQTCLVSCFSVPQCEIIVQSEGFLESAMDWNAKRKEFQGLIGDFSSGIDAVRFDASAIDYRLGILSSMSALAQDMGGNGIFLGKGSPGCKGSNVTRRCYEYCPPIDYSQALISSQQANLASLKSAIANAGQQHARAEAILNRSAENDAYLASRGKDYEEFKLRMKSSVLSLKTESMALAQSVLDPLADEMIAQLEGISAQAKNYSNAGLYRKALSLRPQYESLSNEAEQRLERDGAQYAAYLMEVSGIEGKLKNSAWLIGNASALRYRADLSALKANYASPLTLAKIGGASLAAQEISAELDAEIAAKAVQAGNSSSPPQLPRQPQAAIPDFVWIAAIALASALIYALMLRFSRRAPPAPPPIPPSL